MIEFENRAQLEKRVDAMVDRFTGLVVTKETYKSSKEVRAQINKAIKIIDRQRIDKFNQHTKSLTKKLSSIADDLNQQLKVYDDKRRAGKHEIQYIKFKQLLDEYGLQEDQIEYNSKWDNLSLAFPTFVKEAKEACRLVEQKQEQLKEIRQAVIARGDELGIGVQPFLEQVGKKDLAAILREMSKYKQELIDVQRKKDELQKEFEKNNKILPNGKVIDTKTGEVVDEKVTVRLIIKDLTRYQIAQLKSYLRDNGLHGTFRVINNEVTNV